MDNGISLSMANFMNDYQSVKGDPVISAGKPRISIYGKKDFEGSFWQQDEGG